MQIQCTSCKAILRLSDDKEGAKVRCPSCSHVFVARPMGARGASARAKQDNSKMMIFGGVGVVGAILLAVVMSGGDSTPAAPAKLPELVEEVVITDPTGWDSDLVKAARKLHKTAFERNRDRLRGLISFDKIYARVKSTEERKVIPGDWGVLANDQQILFETEVIDGLLDTSTNNLVGAWTPFDGEVIAEDETSATVRITLEPQDAQLGVQTRSIDWIFIKKNGRWKAWSWERWISPEEMKGNRVARTSKVKNVVLDDGSKVKEAEPSPLEWMDETTQEERANIERLIAIICSPDSRGGDLFSARNDLVAICKPAIPALLTQFYEVDLQGFESYENQTAGMQLHKVLTEITGYATTFKAHEALGATEQRRNSGVKQWFSWYHRRFRKFQCESTTVSPEEETLFKPLNERDRRDLERAKREAQNN